MKELIPKNGRIGQVYFRSRIGIPPGHDFARQTRLRYIERMPRLYCLLLLLSACSDTRSLNYAGSLKPMGGICDPATAATMTLRRGELLFAPAEGTLLLHGEISGNSLAADLTLVDANKHPYKLIFRGTRDGEVISGVYRTPRCSYAVLLKLTGD